MGLWGEDAKKSALDEEGVEEGWSWEQTSWLASVGGAESSWCVCVEWGGGEALWSLGGREWPLLLGFELANQQLAWPLPSLLSLRLQLER